MRRTLAGLLMAVAPISVKQAVAQEPQSARACDEAAADPYDPARPAAIKGIEKIDAKTAIPACQTALATDPGNPRLLFEMGRAYSTAHNDRMARQYFEQASALGYSAGQLLLGIWYTNGSGGLPRDDREASRLFRGAAEQGNAFGQAWLASFYAQGRGGLPKSLPDAVHFYKLAADQGIGDAQYNLGSIYLNGGDGVSKNSQEAARLFKLAASQGIADAEAKLDLAKHPGVTVNGIKVVTQTAFVEQLRQALSGQNVSLGAYDKDIAMLSKLATECPASMPKPDFRAKDYTADFIGINQTVDRYYDTPSGRACEIKAIEPGEHAFVPHPLVAGTEPRKLYVYAGALKGAAITPGSDKAAFQIGVYIEPNDPPAARDLQCTRGGPINPVINRCMHLIVNALIITEDELVAVKQRADVAKRKQQAADAAAAEQRQRDADAQAARDREAAAWAAFSRDAQKLVCLSVNDFLIGYGKTIRLRVNTEKKLILDSAGLEFTYRETDTSFDWAGDGVHFKLDRTTLALEGGGIIGGSVVYQCQKDQPQL